MARSPSPSTLGLWTGLVVVLMASSACAETYHDEDLLQKYVHLCQMLRYQTKKKANNLMTRITNLRNDMTLKRNDINNRLADAMNLATDPLDRVANVSSYLKMNYAPMVNVYAPDTYSSTQDPMYTNVQEDMGMGYDAEGGKVMVMKPGVYQVEYKVQIISYYYAAAEVTVLDPEGDELFNIKDYWEYSCSPWLHMFELEAGSVIKISGLQGYYESWGGGSANPNWLNTGYTSQLNIRYFGPLPAN